MTRWLVDGMNVIGARPDGWWRDRRRAMRELTERLRRFADKSGEPVAVVFDGRPFEIEGGDVDVGFASAGGRNAADREIVARVEGDDDPASLTVVTSDRELVDRVGAAGARVLGSGGFRRTLDEL